MLFVVFLWIGTTLLFSILMGKYLVSDKIWRRLQIFRGLQMGLSLNLNMQILVILSPWVLFDPSLRIMFLISSIKTSKSESDLFVIKGKSEGNVLPLSVSEHCFAKKELRFRSFFEVSDKFIIAKKWWNTGNIFTI